MKRYYLIQLHESQAKQAKEMCDFIFSPYFQSKLFGTHFVIATLPLTSFINHWFEFNFTL